jgi:hypothetical protein
MAEDIACDVTEHPLKKEVQALAQNLAESTEHLRADVVLSATMMWLTVQLGEALVAMRDTDEESRAKILIVLDETTKAMRGLADLTMKKTIPAAYSPQ